MKAHLRKLASDLGETFWLVPGIIVVLGVIAAFGLVRVDRSGMLPDWLLSGWLYDGGATGARTLLGAVASSTIGVAGTVFSITIAGLSLAAGQMGPRLLRNFTRDRGNQITMGIFLGTFSYALVVLRSVRTRDEGEFVPHLSLSVGILLAFLCVVVLVYFVGHMAGRINVDTVVELVGEDVQRAIRRLAVQEKGPAPPDAAMWRGAAPVMDSRRGYLQQFDADALADWAAAQGAAIRLLVRPGDFIFPGAPIAVISPQTEGADAAIRSATALGSERAAADDMEFAVRQLVEVAVRALSPGINDPHTAISVLDRLGAALCDMAPLHLPSGVSVRDGRAVVVFPGFNYTGLTDTMFHMIRQNAGRSPAVLIRILEVLTAVVSCEHEAERIGALQRHADLVLGDAERQIATPADLDDIRDRYRDFRIMRDHGPAQYVMVQS
ncbi:MAG TPA: DUF2254 domain-containing protein [Xanthobacteraceae bacterium]|nr:DUF2254 domain-containing protein [Xanthobacteraceae bacterium]